MIEVRIEKIFAKVFFIDDAKTINRSNYEKWDSLKHIELILELEEEFNLEIDDKISLEIVDFNSCLKVIESLSL